MKKTFWLLAITSLSLAGMQSCNKEEIQKAAITQSINAEMKVNESYTFTLPKNKRDDPYEITADAQHSSISLLSVDASGNRIYKYTPALNFVGTDQVIVSNDLVKTATQHPVDGNCSGGPPKGNCDGGQEDHYIVTINFTVDNSTTSPTTSKN